MLSFENYTNGELLMICLVIFLAVLIFPRLIRRRRINKLIFEKKSKNAQLLPEDFVGNTKLFYSHNAKHNEVEELASKLKTFAVKFEMKLILPGSFKADGCISPTTMILAGKFGLLLIRCYGFGGHIYTSPDQKKWMQNMNQQIHDIPNPIESMKQEKTLMEKLLKEVGYSGVHVYTASVFTKNDVILSIAKPYRVFDRTEFIHWLQEESFLHADHRVAVRELTNILVENIKNKNAASGQ